MKSFRIITVSVNLIWWSLDNPEWRFIHYSHLSINLLEWPISDISCEDCTAQLSILSYLGNARMLPLLYIYFVFSWKLYLVISIFGRTSTFYVLLFLNWNIKIYLIWTVYIIIISHCNNPGNIESFVRVSISCNCFNMLRINCETKIN